MSFTNDQESKEALSKWQGQGALSQGLAIFVGQAGDNELHSHVAHQLTIGLDGLVTVIGPDALVASEGVYIQGGRPHQLLPGRVLSVYLDPTTSTSQSIITQNELIGIKRLPKQLLRILRHCFMQPIKLSQGLTKFENRFQHSIDRDPRINQVCQILDAELEEMESYSLAIFANKVQLSPSRFSHWFKEKTGMSLRTYRKWRKLIRGLELTMQQQDATRCAHQAGFSDQAHFTRTCKQMFGVTPKLALKGVRKEN